MNVVKIQGGLGNQMFQFAFGIYLNHKFDIDVAYDLSFFNNQQEYILSGNDHRNFDLTKIFPCVSSYLETEDKILFLPNRYRINTVLRRLGFIYLGGKIYSYKKDPQIALKTFIGSDFSSNSYFEGYWQNLHYVQEVAATLRNLFYVNFHEISGNQNFKDIQTNESVSIHIRRGDYLKSTIFRCVEMEYLLSSIKLISERIKEPMFFLFTDDLQWGESILTEISDRYPSIRLVKGSLDIEDLVLMSCCKHNIICNSTYSWWASFLNANPDKVVVSPYNWTYNEAWNAYIRESLLTDVVTIINN